ncbi:MAG TPA: carboxypeptidase-like regulatory domain-containing protein, partial [Polyangiaceae bacterium]|nr:carboxypeptidase-like regulatory domain-containing protein [Polyangiaceae bacterium]
MYSRPLGSTLLALSLGLLGSVGCGGEDEKPAPPPPKAGTVGSNCDPAKDNSCNDGLACEEAADGGHRCATELYLQGIVKDSATGDPIEGARVMAVNDEGFPVTDVATTDAKGAYELAVPAPRDADGAPAGAKFTLRAAAQDYQAFPNGPRVALPIDVKDAAEQDGRLEIESTLTTIELVPLPDGDRSKIEGTLLALDSHADAPVGGVLVVATGGDGAVSGLSDKAGAF